jgi:hypothetical protein
MQLRFLLGDSREKFHVDRIDLNDASSCNFSSDFHQNHYSAQEIVLKILKRETG